MISSKGEPGGATESSSDVEEKVLRFLESRTRISWDRDLQVFTSGGMSSMFAMELVVYLENTFGISIRGADLRLDNFRTVRAMAALVRRLRPGSTIGDQR